MPVLRRVVWLSLVGLLGAGSFTARTQQPAAQDKVNLKAVKYDALAQEVLKHRGKVVVVDTWGIT